MIAKHRQAALRFGFCRFVLQYVPVLCETTILDPDNIGGDPGNGTAMNRGDLNVVHYTTEFRNEILTLLRMTFGVPKRIFEQKSSAS